MNASKTASGSRFWAIWLSSGALGTVGDGVAIAVRPRRARRERRVEAPTASFEMILRRHGPQTILVWHRLQIDSATLYGDACCDPGFVVEVCADPDRRLAELGQAKAFVYNHR